MFHRLADIGLGTGKVMHAEVDGLLLRAQRLLVWGGAAILGVSAIVLGGLGLTAGLLLWLGGEVGWVAAVLISGGGVAAVGALLAALAHLRIRRSTARAGLPRSIRARAKAGKMQIMGQSPGSTASGFAAPFPESPASDHPTSWTEQAVSLAAKNPAAVVGGLLCIVSIIGPFRAIKLLSRGAMLAGMISGVREQLGAASDPRDPDGPASDREPAPSPHPTRSS